MKSDVFQNYQINLLGAHTIIHYYSSHITVINKIIYNQVLDSD